MNLDKLTYAGNEINHHKYQNDENYNFIKADICDKNKVSEVFFSFKPDI